MDPESGAPRRLGGVVTVDVDTGLQPEAGTMQLVQDPESKDGSEGPDQEIVNFGKSSLSLRPDLGVLPEEEEDQENNSEGKDNEDSRPEATEPLNSSSESDTDEELGTSASVQEEKREFEAGLSDLRHKLAQEVIIEEDDEEANEEVPQQDGDQNFGMMKFRRSGKSTDAKLSELEQQNGMLDGPAEMTQQLARSESKSNQEKFAPMNIGGNRTSSRNSFVLNTISRFETQSIASIKGEDMDSLIDGFHIPKDDESADMRARDRPRRKERPAADPSSEQLEVQEGDRRESRKRQPREEREREAKNDPDEEERRREERRKRREKEKRRRERREDEREGEHRRRDGRQSRERRGERDGGGGGRTERASGGDSNTNKRRRKKRE